MLTPKQEAFCLAYIETGNASEAYRRTYNVEKMKPETVNRKAKALLDNGKIAARVAELRAVAAKAAQMTLATHLRELKDIRDKAVAAGKYSAAVAAEIARGKAAGLYVDRHEVTGKDGGPVQTEEKNPVATELIERVKLNFSDVLAKMEKQRDEEKRAMREEIIASLPPSVQMHLKAQEKDQPAAQTGSA